MSAPDLQVYHCRGARSMRVVWALEELGLAYQLHTLPFPPRVLAKDYLAINPLGTVPFLIDGETRMSESSAICHYLAEKHGPSPMALQPGEPDFGAYLNFLHQADATLTFPLTLVLRYTLLEPPERRQTQVAQDYLRFFLGRLRWLELAKPAPYLFGRRFTMADIAVGYALHLAEVLEAAKDLPPATAAYFANLKERPAYKRACAL